MAKTPDLHYAFGLEPKDAIKYFESLGHKITWDWQQSAEATRAKAFAVSKSGSLDVLKDLRDGLVANAKSGESEKAFIDRMSAVLQAKGWWGRQQVVGPNGEPQTVQLGSPARLRTIYRTNMQSAFMAGRWKQFQATKAAFPYLQYIAVMDAVTRPTHAAMNGLVFSIDDAIWQTHYPPCDYNCRCRARSLTAGQVKARGLKVQDSTGDRFTEQVDVGDGVMAEVAGYRTPPRPVRVATRDSAPGAFPRIKAGQEMWWDPEQDPQFVDGEGPAWRLQVKRTAMRTGPGFGFNQGMDVRWDSTADLPDVLPGEAAPTKRVMRMVDGQPTWKEAGRPDLRNVPDAQRAVAPDLLPEAATREDALKQLADVLGVSEAAPTHVIETPVERVMIDYGLLPHAVEKSSDARERFANFVLPTLQTPFEVYLTEYEDGFRTRYIGLFQGKQQLLVIARINRDGTVLWNIIQADVKTLNKQRVGKLLYSSDGGKDGGGS